MPYMIFNTLSDFQSIKKSENTAKIALLKLCCSLYKADCQGFGVGFSFFGLEAIKSVKKRCSATPHRSLRNTLHTQSISKYPQTLRHAALLSGVSTPWLARNHPVGSHAALKRRCSPITSIQQYHGIHTAGCRWYALTYPRLPCTSLGCFG